MNSFELLSYFKETGTISYGEFVGKSGEKYSIETDLRNSMLTYKSAITLGKKLYETIRTVLGFFRPVIGVPETGSLLAGFINSAYFKDTDCDFCLNMLRASPKEYQSSSNSVYTVLPLNCQQEYILIEDDVVTGKTLTRYLDQSISNGIKVVAVVSVFGRKKAVPVLNYCKKNNIVYYELINVDEISQEV